MKKTNSGKTLNPHCRSPPAHRCAAGHVAAARTCTPSRTPCLVGRLLGSRQVAEGKNPEHERTSRLPRPETKCADAKASRRAERVRPPPSLSDGTAAERDTRPVRCMLRRSLCYRRGAPRARRRTLAAESSIRKGARRAVAVCLKYRRTPCSHQSE